MLLQPFPRTKNLPRLPKPHIDRGNADIRTKSLSPL